MEKQETKQEAFNQLPVLLTFGQNVEVNLFDILSIDGFGNYSKIQLASGKHIVLCKCLYRIETKMLTGLIRLNRQSIIPIWQIQKVVYYNKSLVIVTTKTDAIYRISRRRIDSVLKAIDAKRGDGRSARSRSLYLPNSNKIVQHS